MSIRRRFRDFAPFWDNYDTGVTGVLAFIIILGYATFVESISVLGIIAAWPGFVENSGLLALVTAWTAIIGLYRLRHRQDKTRPSVREDFTDHEREGPTDFGLRNFGPGPALYIQAVATVEQGPEVTSIPVHRSPIHLREGDFASLVPDAKDDWTSEMAEKYEIDQSESGSDCDQEDSPQVNLYYSYVSQSGARTPTGLSAERDDSDVLDKLKERNGELRRIELSRVVNACRTMS